jgi:hypothetical protein
MTDEELLAELDAAMRRRPGAAEPLTASLQRFANGEATDDVSGAVASELGFDDAARQALVRPLDTDFRRTVVERAIAQRGERTTGETRSRAHSGPTMAAKPRRRWTMAAGASVTLALAASFVVWTSSRHPVDALPLYAMSTSGGESELRGSAAPDGVHMRSDSTLSVVLQPVRPVAGPLDARAAIVGPHGAVARTLESPIDVSAEGVVRLRAPATALFADGLGEVDVVIVVARPGTLPSDADAIAHADGSDGSALRVGRVHVDMIRDR